MNYIDTSRPPVQPARKAAPYSAPLMQTEEHHLCPGCGEPVAIRMVAEVLHEMALADKNIAVFGHGCYGPFVAALDVECTLCLHGRGPAVATGMKRMRPECLVWTMQGDGDMVSEGLAEVMHTAARGENITCIMLNNGVFGDTGGQMTAATVVGQRTKNTLEGRDAKYHGMPISIGSLSFRAPPISRAARCIIPPRSPRPSGWSAAPSNGSFRVWDSGWSRSSPCARPAGCCRRRAGPNICSRRWVRPILSARSRIWARAHLSRSRADRLGWGRI